MELAYALVVLVGAPNTACEEFVYEDCALLSLTVPWIWEAVYYFGEFCVRAGIEELCQGGRCKVWCSGVYICLSFTFP